jgi:hypothetical protein
MSGVWSSSEASPFGGSPATGGRRRRSARTVKGKGKAHLYKMGGDESEAERMAREAAEAAAAAGPGAVKQGGRRHHLSRKAKSARKAASAFKKLSKKLLTLKKKMQK